MSNDEARKKIEAAVGRIDFPLKVDLDNFSNVVGISYEPEWKTGGTEPVYNDAGEVVDYAENYEHHKLTKSEISKLDKAIESIMGA